MGRRLEHYEAYMASLPDGIDSYPDATTKGSMVRLFIQGIPSGMVEHLPDKLRSWIEVPPQVTERVPFVVLGALGHASRDLRFFEYREFLDWFAMGMAGVLANPMYRILVSMADPLRMVRKSPHAWSAFYKGLDRTNLEIYENGSRGMVTYPPHLMDKVLADAAAVTFVRALALSRAADPTVEVEEWNPERFVTISRFDRTKPLGPRLE